MITFYVAAALPVGPRPPAGHHTQQRLPGRQPLSTQVMTFAGNACFRHGAAGLGW
jgi:hypothetical protein